MKKVQIIIFIMFIIFINPSSIQAIDSTKSALELFKADLASRAADPIIKNEVTKKLQNKAYIGTVKSKNSTSLVLSVRDSQRNININEYTEYVIKSKKSVGDAGLKNITIDSQIASLGDIDDKGTLTAKRIIKLNSPIPILPKIINGIITSISNGKAKLQTARNDQFSIIFDKNTEYQTGKKEGGFDDIRTNKWIIVSGQSSGSAEIEASYVYIFPNAITAKPKIATPSAVKKAN